MGLSAWKILLVLGVIVFLFLPRFIRLGETVKGLARRFVGDRTDEFVAQPERATVIDGETGMVIRPKAPPAPKTLPERIGLALGRLVRRLLQPSPRG